MSSLSPPLLNIYMLTHPTVQGIATPEDCVPEFPTDGNTSSYQPWDIIPMDLMALVSYPAVASAVACQALCAGDSFCQYYVWYDYNGALAGADAQCFIRMSPELFTFSSFDPATKTLAVLFEVRPRRPPLWGIPLHSRAQSAAATCIAAAHPRGSAFASSGCYARGADIPDPFSILTHPCRRRLSRACTQCTPRFRWKTPRASARARS